MDNIKPIYLRTDFFAARYNLNIEDLSWAIAVLSCEDECWSVAALKIKDQEAYVDIENDTIVSFSYIRSTEGRDVRLIDATLKGEKLIFPDTFFKGRVCEYEINHQRVERRYYSTTPDNANFEQYKIDLSMYTKDDIVDFINTDEGLRVLANKFCIEVENLSWVVVETSSDEYFDIRPMLKVKNDDIHIDLYQNRISLLRSSQFISYTIHDAYMKDGVLHYRDGNDTEQSLEPQRFYSNMQRYFQEYVSKR
ncbi:MAG: hypothetical protein SNI49_07540 [Rikenellaceae bacterium]